MTAVLCCRETKASELRLKSQRCFSRTVSVARLGWPGHGEMPPRSMAARRHAPGSLASPVAAPRLVTSAHLPTSLPLCSHSSPRRGKGCCVARSPPGPRTWPPAPAGAPGARGLLRLTVTRWPSCRRPCRLSARCPPPPEREHWQWSVCFPSSPARSRPVPPDSDMSWHERFCAWETCCRVNWSLSQVRAVQASAGTSGQLLVSSWVLLTVL